MSDNAVPPAPGQRPAERRTWVRHACDLVVSCHPYISGKETLWSGRALDISRGGIRIETDRPFELWAAMILRIRNPGAGISLTSLARVLHLDELEAGKWLVGYCFARPVSDEDLQALLKPPA